MLYIIPIFIGIIFLYALIKRTPCYETFIEGASKGMKSVITIFPCLLSMIFATSLLEASGLIQFIFKDFSFFLPSEIIMQSIFRPLSGNASLGIMTNIYDHYGVDSKNALISSILQGSSDTTIYVTTLYFSSIGIKKIRYAIPLGILCDIIGFIVSLGIIFLFIH